MLRCIRNNDGQREAWQGMAMAGIGRAGQQMAWQQHTFLEMSKSNRIDHGKLYR